MSSPERKLPEPKPIAILARRIPKWMNPVNPESMRDTALSTTAIIKEANQIVRQAAFRMKIIANGIDDKPTADAADNFLRARFKK